MTAPIDFNKIIGLLGLEHAAALDQKLTDAFVAAIGGPEITPYEKQFMFGRMITMGAYALAHQFDADVAIELAAKASVEGVRQYLKGEPAVSRAPGLRQ